jgi:hypothetical protein
MHRKAEKRGAPVSEPCSECLRQLAADPDAVVTTHDRLGGLIHEYAQVA